MPPLNEGTILYMPTSLPGMSVQKSSQILQTQDRVLKEFPEVDRVFGKMGRARTATDPAPDPPAAQRFDRCPRAGGDVGRTDDRIGE